MAFKKVTTLALAAGIALAASGCSIIGDQIEDAVGGGIEEAVEGAIENQTGTDIELGNNVDLPNGWPDLPTPDGQLAAAIGSDDGYWLQYVVADASVADALVAEYEGAGFTLEAETDLGGITSWVLNGEEWSVAIGLIGDDTGEDYGLTVTANPVQE